MPGIPPPRVLTAAAHSTQKNNATQAFSYDTKQTQKRPPAARENMVQMKLSAKHGLSAVSVGFLQYQDKKHNIQKRESRAPTVVLMKNPLTVASLKNIPS